MDPPLHPDLGYVPVCLIENSKKMEAKNSYNFAKKLC